MSGIMVGTSGGVGDRTVSLHTGTAAQYVENEIAGLPTVNGFKRVVVAQGTLTPTTLQGYSGIQVRQVGNYADNSRAYLRLDGWGADPGQAWLARVTGNGTSLTGASANTYIFGSTIATWFWDAQTFGFTNGGSILLFIDGS